MAMTLIKAPRTLFFTTHEPLNRVPLYGSGVYLSDGFRVEVGTATQQGDIDPKP